MSDVTEADRAKAVDVLASARADEMWRTDNPSDLVTRIAAALAEEREKARAPFLAEIATTEAIAAQLEHSDKYWNGWIDAAENIITRFRRAAEGTL